MKRKVFIPKELKNKDSFFSFGTVSTTCWDFASQMETKAIEEFNSRYNSFYVFPTIVFYCASFETLLNEGLNKLLLYNKNIEDELDIIKNCRNEYRDLAKKVKVCAKYLDKKKLELLMKIFCKSILRYLNLEMQLFITIQNLVASLTILLDYKQHLIVQK